MNKGIENIIGIVIVDCSLKYQGKEKVENVLKNLGITPHVWFTCWIYDDQCFVLLYYTNKKSEALMKLKFGNNLDDIIQEALDGKL